MKEQIAKLLYAPAMSLLLLSMLIVSIGGGVVYYYSAGLSGVIEPSFFKYVAHTFATVAELLRTENNASLQLLLSIVLFVSGLVMGVFLLRCVSTNNTLEVLITITFLTFALIQLLIVALLPDIDHASEYVSDAESLLGGTTIVLKASANMCIAIFGASVGVNINQENEEV